MQLKSRIRRHKRTAYIYTHRETRFGQYRFGVPCQIRAAKPKQKGFLFSYFGTAKCPAPSTQIAAPAITISSPPISLFRHTLRELYFLVCIRLSISFKSDLINTTLNYSKRWKMLCHSPILNYVRRTNARPIIHTYIEKEANMWSNNFDWRNYFHVRKTAID